MSGDSEKLDALLAEAEANLLLRRLDAAEDCARCALTLAPGNLAAQTLIGRILNNAGRLAEAEQAFVAAIELDAENSASFNLLGHVRRARETFCQVLPGGRTSPTH